jgi:dolichol kinase
MSIDEQMIDEKNFEIRRKMFHVFVGVILVLLIYYGLLAFWMTLALLIIGIFISLLSIKYSIPIIKLFLMKYDRPEHSNTPAKGVISIFSALSVLLLFMESGFLSKNIVLASLMIWTFGDSLSAVVGKLYGRKKHPLNQRFIEGTIAGIIGGTIGATFFVPVYAAFPAAFIAMIIESLELRLLKHPIDDNLLVPLIAAGLLYWML